MANILLIHGAWHGAWCWYKIVPRLEALGHRVLAIDLPGHGRHQIGRAATLDDYRRAGLDALAQFDDPAVIVGHSMGGMILAVLSEFAPDKIRRATYLTAYLGPAGAPMSSAAGQDHEGILGQYMIPTADFTYFNLAPEGLQPAFYHDCSAEDLALAKACLTPQPIAPMTAPIDVSAERFGRIPRTYIECRDDRAVGLTQQRRYQSYHPAERVVLLNASHSPFFSMPDALSQILDQDAKS